MKLFSLVFWAGSFSNAIVFAVGNNSTRSSFIPECILTSQITTKVAGRTVTVTLTSSQSDTATTIKSFNTTSSPKNGTLATDNRYGKLWKGKYTKDGFLSNLTSGVAPTILCSSIADFASSCSCVSITRVTTTSTIRSSTATLMITRTVNSKKLGSSLNNSSRLPVTSKTLAALKLSSSLATSSSQETARPQTRLTGASPNTERASPTGRFLNTTVSSTSLSKSPVVYVMNTTTLITVTTAEKGSISAGGSLSHISQTGRYLNTTTASAKPSQGFHLPFWRLNITATGFFSRTNTTSLQAHKVALLTGTATGTGLSHLSNTTSSRPLWLNTTRATPTAALTTGPRLFTANTAFTFANTTVRWANTTTTSSIPTPTAIFPTSCGKSSAPFSLQISYPSTPFDNWFVHLSARALLFGSRSSQASRFSIEAGGYLCVVGLVDETEEQRPYVAAIGVKEGQRGEIWMVSKEMLDVWGDDYVALGCTQDGGLNCGAMRNGTDVGEVREWAGCGMQLGLGSGNGTVAECGSVGVRVLEGGDVDGEVNDNDEFGEMRFEKRVVNPWAFTSMS